MKLIFLACIPALFLYSRPALGQKFDVAAIRINRSGSAGGEGQTEESVTSTPGNLTMKNVTLRTCIKWAYGLRDFQIFGGPNWISTERYDISAKAASGTSDIASKKMLQALLAERFQLHVREDSKELPVYGLIVVKKTSTLKLSAGTEPASMRPADGFLEFRNMSMAELSERLANRPLSVDRPVVDKTRLVGGYDFSLKFAGNAAELKSALEDIDRGTGPSVSSVLQEQLGLKLEPEKSALSVLVIDHANEIPGEN